MSVVATISWRIKDLYMVARYSAEAIAGADPEGLARGNGSAFGRGAIGARIEATRRGTRGERIPLRTGRGVWGVSPPHKTFFLILYLKVAAAFQLGGHSFPGEAHSQKCGVELPRWENQRRLSSIVIGPCKQSCCNAPMQFFSAKKPQKCFSGRGSAPDLAGGACSAPHAPRWVSFRGGETGERAKKGGWEG